MRHALRLGIAGLFIVAGAGCGAQTPINDVQRPRVVVLRQVDGAPPPSQGLLVEQGPNTLLADLRGQPYARLVHARPWWATADTARNAPFKALAEAVPTRTIFIGPRHSWYVWDAGKARLRPLARPRLQLPGGIVVFAHPRSTTDDRSAYEVDLEIRRGGRLVVPRSRHLRFVSPQLIATQTLAVDLHTRARWKFSGNCVPAGTLGVELFVACTSSRLPYPTRLAALSTDGRRRMVARLPKSLYAFKAAISPNGRYIVATLSPGCGPSYSFLVPVSGGAPVPLAGSRRWSMKSPPATALGWTADSRLVAFVERSGSCDSESRAGVYLINPRTLVRTFLYPKYAVMWNPSFG
jgi:hypothetical protein